MQASYKNALAVGICALTLILTGCAAPAVVNCPPVKEWTPQEEENMALVVNRLPIDSPVVGVFEDYARMRAEARACASAK